MRSISSPIKGIESETETNNEYNETEQTCENKNEWVMNEFDKSFNFYKSKFLENVKKLMNHLPDDSLSYRFKVWIMASSAFFERKAEDESEIWSDTFG